MKNKKHLLNLLTITCTRHGGFFKIIVNILNIHRKYSYQGNLLCKCSNASSLMSWVVDEEGTRPVADCLGWEQCLEFPSLLFETVHWETGRVFGLESKICAKGTLSE